MYSEVANFEFIRIKKMFKEYTDIHEIIRPKYAGCKTKTDYKKFKLYLDNLLKKKEYSDEDLRANIRYYHYLADLKISDYDALEKNLKNEDLNMLKYYRVHKLPSFYFFFVGCIFFSILQYLFVINFFKNDIISYVLLLYIPIMLSAVFIEYSVINIVYSFNKLYREILDGELEFDETEYKYEILIEMFSAWAYREIRTKRAKIFLDHKLVRYFVILSEIILLWDFFSVNFYATVSIVVCSTVILYSNIRSVIGNVPSYIVGNINFSKAKLNIFAIDNTGGFRNVFTIYGYRISKSFIKAFTAYVCYFTLDLIYSQDIIPKGSGLFKFEGIQYIFFVGVALNTFNCLRNIVKAFSLYNRITKLKNSLKNKILNKGKEKTIDYTDTLSMNLVDNFHIISWLNINKFYKIIVIIITITFNFTLAIYPQFYKEIFNNFWNFMFR